MLNKVILIGNLGNNPEVKTMQSGDRVCNLSVATSENWKDKKTGERKSKTEWHKIVIFNQILIDIVEKYLTTGSKVYIEGQIETRKWSDQSGVDRYSTEIVLKNFNGVLKMLDGKSSDNENKFSGKDATKKQAAFDANQPLPNDGFEDTIPF